jgi:hypothetical protein
MKPTTAGLMLGVLLTAGAPPIHSVRGVVRTVSASSLTLTVGSGSHVRLMTFVVTPATEREGRLEVGVTASIRYEIRGKRLVMTAVSTHPEALSSGR